MKLPELRHYLTETPLVAILRGVTPAEAPAIAASLVESGFRIIEVPLNSPQPLKSIAAIAHVFGDDVLVGAGTVLTEDEALQVLDSGGQILVAPDLNLAVGQVAKRAGVAWCPGVFTANEAFSALGAGADAIKLFPAEAMPPNAVKALRAVLPAEALLLPVGSIGPDNIKDYWRAGASGFGLGGSLYKPGMTAPQVAVRARQFVEIMQSLQKS